MGDRSATSTPPLAVPSDPRNLAPMTTYASPTASKQRAIVENWKRRFAENPFTFICACVGWRREGLNIL